MGYCLNPTCGHHNSEEVSLCPKCGAKLILNDRYRAIELIGRGSFGKTFLAQDELRPSKPLCVIKQFLPQNQEGLQKATELFHHEAVRLDQLGKHAQIPELLAHFDHENHHYLVQEFIDGKNLAQELAETGAFDEVRIRNLLENLFPVLQFIHAGQVIHRDIKPENIIQRSKSPTSPDQEGDLVLVDFGAAKYATTTALERPQTIIGDPRYISPEQAIGRATFASDIYSLGVTCLHLLTNTPPFQLFDTSENDWDWRQIEHFVSEGLEQILAKMVQQATKRRYQSADEVLRDLSYLSPAKRSLPITAIDTHNIYTRLQEFLAKGQWQDADEETKMVMLFIAQRERENWLDEESIDRFPCSELNIINQLWLQASDGRFGFSVQKQIWLDVEAQPSEYNYKVYEKFGDRVGWRAITSDQDKQQIVWLGAEELTFSPLAPVGHLPRLIGLVWGYVGGEGVWSLFSRIDNCGM